MSHPKLAELVRRDPFDWSDARDALAGHDAGFVCPGVTAAGMSEADYMRTTYELTLAAATALARLSPGMTLVYASGPPHPVAAHAGAVPDRPGPRRTIRGSAYSTRIATIGSTWSARRVGTTQASRHTPSMNTE